MDIIDLHCDTIAKLAEIHSEAGLKENSLSIDIGKLQTGGSLGQFFALFFDLQETKEPLVKAKELLNYFQQEMLVNKNYIRQAKTIADIKNNQAQQYLSAILTLEGGEALAGDIENLRWFYEQGIRLITLTWNYPNSLGYPNIDYQYKDCGLTDFGRECVETMQELGIIVDVAHLSDKGFYDVADLMKVPFVASHSNSRAVMPHCRNLSDAMISCIAEHGGVVGLNFCSDFLDGSKVSKVAAMLLHIKHIYQVGGIDVLALGSDFDGIDSKLEIADFSKLNILWSALGKAGFSSAEIDKITHKNAWRVMQDCWKK